MILTKRSTTNNLVYADGTSGGIRTQGTVNYERRYTEGYLDCTYFYICPMDYEVDIGVNRMLHETAKPWLWIWDLGGATSQST